MTVAELLSVIIRALLQALAGVLVSKGFVTEAEAGPFVEQLTIWLVGGIILFATIVWSIWSKQKSAKVARAREIAAMSGNPQMAADGRRFGNSGQVSAEALAWLAIAISIGALALAVSQIGAPLAW